jgi:uncharacterized glyoxalase superfamily protein PhnB
MSDQTFFPTLRFRDPDAAIDWLERALGFTRHAVHRGGQHLELRHLPPVGGLTRKSSRVQAVLRCGV